MLKLKIKLPFIESRRLSSRHKTIRDAGMLAKEDKDNLAQEVGRKQCKYPRWRKRKTRSR